VCVTFVVKLDPAVDYTDRISVRGHVSIAFIYCFVCVFISIYYTYGICQASIFKFFSNIYHLVLFGYWLECNFEKCCFCTDRYTFIVDFSCLHVSSL